MSAGPINYKFKKLIFKTSKVRGQPLIARCAPNGTFATREKSVDALIQKPVAA